jgi:heptosyltransferase-2
MKRILIIRLSSFGDILLTTLAVRCIRKKFPEAHIDFLTRTPYASLLAGNPHVNNVIMLDVKSFNEVLLIRKKIRGQYDIVVDFHSNLRSIMLTAFNGAKVFRTKRFDFKRRLMVLFRSKNLFSIPSVPLRHLDAVKDIGVADDGDTIEFKGAANAVMAAKTLLLSHHVRDGFIALAPGSRWPTKEWPLSKFQELITLFPQEQFVILGGRQDEEAGKLLEAIDTSRVASFCGKTDPASAGEVLRRSRALVSNDSGLMHLAVAVGVPVLGIFGCTVSEFGFAPFRARSIVLEKGLSCRPCATKGRNKCPKNTLACLKEISVDDAADALEKLLKVLV